ncbi:MAG: DUF523 domain-containing protein [candidate division Zixibacteria bacterium]|nr:DUF523 domain-containing protein [candidate division Zixibacteria bacterium]
MSDKKEKNEKVEKIIISACLLGQKCRYDGNHKKSGEITKLADKFKLIPFCPESLGGLPIPRPPAEIDTGDGISVLDGKSKILDKSGKDVTSNFIEGAKKSLQIAKKYQVKRVFLKSKSPSCGVTTIIRKGNQIKGSGVTAALLYQNGFFLEEFD